MAVRDSRLDGMHPLAYLGTNAKSPPNSRSYDRAPLSTDIKGFYILDEWLDASVAVPDIYKIVAKLGGSATWVKTSFSYLSTGTDGQILVGVSGGDPVFADLTSTGGTIAITGGAGTLNIETVSAPGFLTWAEVTGTTQAMAVDYGYLANNAAPVVFTLPATAAQFTFLEVVGKGAGGFKIEQNAGQTIIWEATASTTTGVTGYLESTDIYDKVQLMCTTVSTEFTVVASKGNITFA